MTTVAPKVNKHIRRLSDYLVCPRCHCKVTVKVEAAAFRSIACTNRDCTLSVNEFPIINGVPCLIDFDRSVFAPDDIEKVSPPIATRTWRRRLASRLEAFSVGSDNGPAICDRFLATLRQIRAQPRVLIIGGGTIGKGTNELYEAADIETIGTDVYFSNAVDIICDGHSLPFENSSFDAVWVQAVLEHVLEPQVVVAEVHRVLRSEGIVCAETPFMQQVHMGAYDFQRFTKSGHRWLFRNFEEIDSGVNGGAGLSLVWSLFYYLRALTRSDVWWQPIRILFGWLARTESFLDQNRNRDGACGNYFIGRRSETSISPKDIILYY